MNRYLSKITSLLIVIIILLCIFIIDGYIEEKEIDKMIYEFKEKGEFIYQENNINYYIVKNNEKNEDGGIIKRENKKTGTIGDIYLFDKSPIENAPLIGWISNKTWIGHCGLVYDNEANEVLETIGNKSISENKVQIFENDWFTSSSPRYIVLRVKGINEENRKKIKEIGESYINKKYNYTFLFSNNNRVNCCELIHDIYKEFGIELNKDSFFSTGSDFITNENTYIIMYKETYYSNNQTFYNVYYLSEE